MQQIKTIELAKRIRALADTGLLYVSNDYDKERYTELKAISLQLLEECTGENADVIKDFFAEQKDYPTAKVDIRCLALTHDRKILMVKESLDGKWSLPGGWADIGYSPAETAIKECKEETGLDVKPERLLAVFDKRLHPHPPQPEYVYKIVILCNILSGTITKGFDVLEVGYFDIDNLPELSTPRILAPQLELVYRKAVSNDPVVYFD